jgi:hypothetical protein
MERNNKDLGRNEWNIDEKKYKEEKKQSFKLFSEKLNQID